MTVAIEDELVVQLPPVTVGVKVTEEETHTKVGPDNVPALVEGNTVIVCNPAEVVQKPVLI